MVSGATGFIGRNICKALKESQIEFATIIRNSPKKTKCPELSSINFVVSSCNIQSDLKKVFNEYKPDLVINAAGVWANANSTTDLGEIIQGNIVFSTHLAIAALKVNSKFYNLSSYWQLEGTSLHTINNFYTDTKKSFETILNSLVDKEGLQCTSLFLYDNFGPGDTRGKVIDLLIKHKNQDGELLMSEPGRYLNLLHITDVVNGIISAVKYKGDGRNFEISNTRLVTLLQLVKLVEKCKKSEIQVKWTNDSNSNEPYANHVSPISPVPGWHPRMDLESGILSMLEEKIE